MAFNWPHGLAARLGTDTGHSIGPFSTTLRRASPTCATVNAPAGPLRGRLGPLPPPVRAGRPDCLADLAFGGTLRVLFPSALPGGRLGPARAPSGACPPALRGLPTGDQPGGLRPPLPAPSPLRYAAAAFRSLRSLHSAGRHWSPFGRPRIRSALTANTSRPSFLPSVGRRSGCVRVRLATLPALRYAAFRSLRDFAFRRSLQTGGASAFGTRRRGYAPRSRSGAGAP